MYFTILGAIAQMERELIQERVIAGLESARKRGRLGGRPKSMTEAKVKIARQLLESGLSYDEVAENINVPKPTLYKYLPASKL